MATATANGAERAVARARTARKDLLRQHWIDLMGRKPKDLVQLTLRIREEVRREIERTASRGHRSMNDEIARRIETYAVYQRERKALLEADERLRKERALLRQAMLTDLGSHPDPATTRAVLEGNGIDKLALVVAPCFPPKC